MPEVREVDVSGLFDEDAPTDRIDHAIWDALRHTGSFLPTGYPGAEHLDTWATTGLQIFSEPPEVQRSVMIAMDVPGNPNWYRGLHPIVPGSPFRTRYFDIGPEDPAKGPDLPGIAVLEEHSVWPDPLPTPDWGDQLRQCYDRLNRVGQTIMASIGRSAGFAMDEIAARFDGAHSTLRFLDYPVLDPPPEDCLAALAHTDQSGLSLLWQADPGLQAQGQDGQWYDIPKRANAVSIHVGEVMTGLTQGRVPATPHRVVDSGTPRQSMGFFLEPRLDAPLTPADVPRDQTTEQDTYAWSLLSTLRSREKYKEVLPPLPGAAQ